MLIFKASKVRRDLWNSNGYATLFIALLVYAALVTLKSKSPQSANVGFVNPVSQQCLNLVTFPLHHLSKHSLTPESVLHVHLIFWNTFILRDRSSSYSSILCIIVWKA